ncbi:MAG: amidohydrolase [Desulfatibacillaceae bacterium]
MEKPDLLITNGTVLTMDRDRTVIPNGAVVVTGDKVTRTGPAAELDGPGAGRVLDARGGLILPGLVNTHTHAAMTCFRGLADDLPLMEWLNRHIFPAEEKLTGDIVYEGTLLACAEMISSGVTCFCDMYLFEDHTARAVADAGMRAVVGEAFFNFPSPNYGALEQGYAHVEGLMEKWRDHPLVNIGVAAHSAYLCAPPVLHRAREIARRWDAVFMIHVSETESEVDEIRKKYGRTPVAHLASEGILGPRLLAAHCVALKDGDVEHLARTDTKVAHNPESNMKLSSGVAPLRELLDAGVCVALGTDGAASNNNLDMLGEMDTCAKLHKAATGDPTTADAATVLAMATRNGARALSMEDSIGSLEPGRQADIIVIDTNRPHLTPPRDPVSALVYAARGGDVLHSVINGRVVLENGRLATIDLARSIARVREIRKVISKGQRGNGGIRPRGA